MIIKKVKLIRNKEFTIVAFDLKHKVFIVYIAILSFNLGNKIHPLRKAQITHLKANKAPIKISSKYTNFADIFLLKLAKKLLKYMKINNHTIKLVYNQQSFYSPIYNLG